MLYRQLPLPDQLQSDPEVAWNFWLMLHELSELLWDRHEQLFYQWARDEYGSGADLAPQASTENPPSSLTADGACPPPPASIDTPSSSVCLPIDRSAITGDDIPF
jgi:hypothetical protein